MSFGADPECNRHVLKADGVPYGGSSAERGVTREAPAPVTRRVLWTSHRVRAGQVALIGRNIGERKWITGWNFVEFDTELIIRKHTTVGVHGLIGSVID